MNILFRITILLTCIFTFLNALVFVAISIYRSIHAYILFFRSHISEHPGIHLVEALDSFLLAYVFFIFSIGFGKLFIPDNILFRNIQIDWLQPKSFSDLKHILWEAVLTTLVVFSAISIIQNVTSLQWTQLILPATIALIAIGSKMLKGAH